MNGHHIICGFGRVGFRIAELLVRLGEQVSVVSDEIRPEWMEWADANGVRVIRGDARDSRRVIEAGLHEARSVIAATDKDIVNIEVAIDAKQLRADVPVIIRLFDQSLAETLEQTLGLRRVLATSALSAPTFAAAAMGERVAAAFRLDKIDYVVGELSRDEAAAATAAGAAIVDESNDRIVVIAPAAIWNDVAPGLRPSLRRKDSLRWLRSVARQLDPRNWLRTARAIWSSAPLPLRSSFLLLLTLALLSSFVFSAGLGIDLVDALYYIVTTITTTGYGDITPLRAGPALKLYAIGLMLGSVMLLGLFSAIVTDYIVATRLEQLLGSQTVPEQGHIIVVGLGHVGFRIEEELQRFGLQTAVVERNAEGNFVEVVRPTTAVLIGDARAHEILEKAGIAKAHAVIAASGDDVVNLGVGLAARKLNPSARTVVRLFDADFARKVRAGLGIDAALSATAIAAPAFAASALDAGVVSAFLLGSSLVSLVQITAPDEWQGKTSNEIRELSGLQPLLVARDGAFVGVREKFAARAGERIVAARYRPVAAAQYTASPRER